MNELIKIQNNNGKETVNARELHSFLEVQTRFNDWIKLRIEKFDFIENHDFLKVTEKIVTSGGIQDVISYYVSLEMAKELSMVENNEKGKQARRYFIECEKKIKQLAPRTFAEALRLAADQAEKLEEQQRLIEQQKPAVEFIEKYVDATNTKCIRDTAKIFGIKEKVFIEMLIDNKLLFRQAGILMPYADKKELFEVKTGQKNGFDFHQTRFTAKGLEVVARIINQEKRYSKTYSFVCFNEEKQDFASDNDMMCLDALLSNGYLFIGKIHTDDWIRFFEYYQKAKPHYRYVDVEKIFRPYILD